MPSLSQTCEKKIRLLKKEEEEAYKCEGSNRLIDPFVCVQEMADEHANEEEGDNDVDHIN